MLRLKDNFNLCNEFKKNKLLIISHNYNDFVKDSSESISPYFEDVNILVRYNSFAEILSYLPFDNFKKYRKNRHIDLLGIPKNIHILPTYVIYGHFDSQYKKIGDQHFKSIEETIKKNTIKFDLIHSHFTWSSGYAGAKLKEKYDVPFIVTAHGYDIYDLPFRDEEWREKIRSVLNTADYVITVSNSNLECIKKLNIKTPIKVIPNGFRKDLFFPRESIECKEALGLPKNKKIILTVGNLLEVKGHSYLIEALEKLLKHRKDIYCVIVGSGRLKNILEKQIKKAGLKDFVKLAGEKSHNEIPIWINACDVFVLSSLKEGNPTVMFECLGCGKPFIGTNVGGIPEIINSELYGFIVKPANSDELMEAIERGLQKKWDQNCIINYAKQYSWDNIVKEIMEIYHEVLEKE